MCPTTKIDLTTYALRHLVSSHRKAHLNLYGDCTEELPCNWRTDREVTVKTIVYSAGPYVGPYFVQIHGFDGTYNAANTYQADPRSTCY